MENSEILRTEALQIIHDLGLIDSLSPYGKSRIVGSVALNLVVKLDIDIHLVLNSLDLMDTVDEISRLFLDLGNIHELRISDYREKNSIKIGIDAYEGFSGDWSIDIWITTDVATTGFTQVERLLNEMLPEQREIILDIKRQLYQEDLLRDGISNLVYRAVIDDKVRSAAEFHRYLEQQNGAV